ncbi:hypothetical protein [Halovivax cerinus]|uniref:Archaeal flagellin-like protein n=1 Tax=Halovivax cerinus TaxID=1487865 RepID=A0ABD5NSG6_9EURY|nr:hypothetical protein [Halovivax cerinus]
MNRRTLLTGAGGLSAFGLVGFFIYNFTLSMPVLLIGENETDTATGLVVTATRIENGQEVFDDPIAVPVDATTQIGRIPNVDAQVVVKRVELAGDEPDESAVIEEQTTLVGEDTKQLTITITDDGLDLALSYRE